MILVKCSELVPMLKGGTYIVFIYDTDYGMKFRTIKYRFSYGVIDIEDNRKPNWLVYWGVKL